MLRKDFDAGATPRQNFLTKLRKDAAKYKARFSREEQVQDRCDDT